MLNFIYNNHLHNTDYGRQLTGEEFCTDEQVRHAHR